GFLIVRQTTENLVAIDNLFRQLMDPRSKAKPLALSLAHYMEDAQRKPPADAAELAKLGMNLPSITFDKMKLEKAIANLRKTTEGNLWVNWFELEKAGVNRDSPVSLNLRNVTAEKALTAMLHAAGPAAGLGFMVDDGAVIISTRDDLQSAKYQQV